MRGVDWGKAASVAELFAAAASNMNERRPADEPESEACSSEGDERNEDSGILDRQYSKIQRRLSCLLDEQRAQAETQLRGMVADISADFDGKLQVLDSRVQEHLQFASSDIEGKRGLLVADADRLLARYSERMEKCVADAMVDLGSRQKRIEATFLKGIYVLSVAIVGGCILVAAAAVI